MKRKKTILVATKIVLAALLLTWVLNKTHWRDYVVTDAGKSYSVVRLADADADGESGYVVSTGMLWWQGQREIPRSDLKPVDAHAKEPEYTHKGFASSIVGINRLLLGVAVVGFVVAILITAVRWWILLKIQNIFVELWEVVRLTFLGQFFNFIVPGTVGGDLVKAYYVSKHTPQKAAVLVSVFVDRLLGFTELSLLAATMTAIALLGGLSDVEQLGRPMVAIGAVLALLAVMLTFLVSDRFRRALHLQKLYGRLPIAHHIAAAGDAVSLYKRRMGIMAKAIGLTVGSHVFFVGAIALLGASLSLDVPWYSYFIFVPLIYIAGAVPITPGGVGVIESLYVAMFVSIGTCTSSEVLALALLARAIPMFWALPGAIVAITGTKIPEAGVIAAELGIEEDGES